MEILAQITADMSYRSVSDFVNDSAKLRIKKNSRPQISLLQILIFLRIHLTKRVSQLLAGLGAQRVMQYQRFTKITHFPLSFHSCYLFWSKGQPLARKRAPSHFFKALSPPLTKILQRHPDFDYYKPPSSEII